MDKLEILGKQFPVQTFVDARPTSAVFRTKSGFSDALLVNVTYDLSGVDTSKDYSELTKEERSRLKSLRLNTPTITSKDSGLRPFVLNALNKGKEKDEQLTLQKLNERLFADGNFTDDGELSETASPAIKGYLAKLCELLTMDTQDVLCVRMSVSELTGGKYTTWMPEWSDKPQSEIVAYEVDENNLMQAALSAVARMFAALPHCESEED